MIKLSAIVINPKYQIMGFIATGKASDFGGIGDVNEERQLSIKWMIENGFNNEQVNIKGSTIHEKGKFRLSSLQMGMFDPNSKQVMPIGNELTLVNRVLRNDTLVGFDVMTQFKPGLEPMAYNTLLQISRWFKPANYVIRSTKTKQIIVGNPSIESLPIRDITTNVPTENKRPEPVQSPDSVKRVKSGAVDIEKVADIKTSTTTNLDLIDLTKIMKEVNGLLVMLPDVDYKPATVEHTGVENGFIPAKAGEFAKPYITYHSKEINASLSFHKVGSVFVEGVGKVPTFQYRKKNIFRNGEGYIEKVGVAIPPDGVAKALEVLNRELAVNRIDDKEWFVRELLTFMPSQDYQFFSMDTARLSLMTASKAQGYILSNPQIATMIKESYIKRLALKYLDKSHGLMRELRSNMSSGDIAKAEKMAIWAPLQQYKKSALSAIEAAGINIYTGSYDFSEEYRSKTSSSTESAEVITIDYLIRGKDPSKLSFKKMHEYEKQKDGEVPAEIIKVVEKFKKYKTDTARYGYALTAFNKLEAEIKVVDEAIRLHKWAMLIAGGHSTIHSHNPGEWEMDMKSKFKGNTYKCITPEAEGLLCICNGVSIV